jgi:hypothetical protein
LINIEIIYEHSIASGKGLIQDFSDKVIYENPSIKFVGIADEYGRLLATKDRKGLSQTVRFSSVP